MILSLTVPIPKISGKIARQRVKSAVYIHYIFDRVYESAKRHTVPRAP